MPPPRIGDASRATSGAHIERIRPGSSEQKETPDIIRRQALAPRDAIQIAYEKLLHNPDMRLDRRPLNHRRLDKAKTLLLEECPKPIGQDKEKNTQRTFQDALQEAFNRSQDTIRSRKMRGATKTEKLGLLHLLVEEALRTPEDAVEHKTRLYGENSENW